jgi:Family of unknown function (DUF6000)
MAMMRLRRRDTLPDHLVGRVPESLPKFADLGASVLPIEGLPRKLFDKLVLGFSPVGGLKESRLEEICRIYPLLTEVNISLLLANQLWHSRIAGARFAALRDIVVLQERIGKLLLRSDYCFASRGYCLALVTFNTPASVEYLQEYLSYYLTRTDLVFDQMYATASLIYLDTLNGTQHLEPLMPLLENYARVCPWFRHDRELNWLTNEIQALAYLKTHLKDLPTPPFAKHISEAKTP